MLLFAGRGDACKLNAAGILITIIMTVIIYLITIISFTINSGHDVNKLSKPDFKEIDNLFKEFDKKDSPGMQLQY